MSLKRSDLTTTWNEWSADTGEGPNSPIHKILLEIMKRIEDIEARITTLEGYHE